MAKHSYKTSGTCSRKIEFDLDENKVVTNLIFEGGCNGNLGGICQLCNGMKAEDIVSKLGGIRCGAKHTSCPDQLAKAVTQALEKE